ncbi:competence type IV pilus ATPase ComGA [Bacillus sp. FJAT-45350]|uniref:competence type IV pilus ATPase ComGA n=1 Tax=Bacillus sp. FJAT-45350 TaxID=2011014 RepID=UPI000BB89F64|nr:competence type IV pilus ATPase ComGA [Bacillus sp. FJAT-45350]
MLHIEQKSKLLIQQAYDRQATDIHIVPRRKDALIRLRINQQLLEYEIVTKSSCEKLISHFKFRAGMDIGEKRRPQSGSMDFINHNCHLHLRISSIPTPFQESLAIRILPQEQTLSLKALSLFPKHTNQLFSFLKRANGLLLLTGPTGSGKTTTLYSLLHSIKELFPRNIITIEDPIEKKTDDFLQIEINEKAGITYTEALRSILRHDPDIIMIGEIRDAKTAELAVRSALTGHLVLATLHAKDTIGALHRLTDLNIPLIDLEQTLLAVVSQRLVNVTCPYCGGSCHPLCIQLIKKNRYSLYEILAGDALKSRFDLLNGNIGEQIPYDTLEKGIKRGIALGFLHQSYYEKYIGEKNEKR